MSNRNVHLLARRKIRHSNFLFTPFLPDHFGCLFADNNFERRRPGSPSDFRSVAGHFAFIFVRIFNRRKRKQYNNSPPCFRSVRFSIALCSGIVCVYVLCVYICIRNHDEKWKERKNTDGPSSPDPRRRVSILHCVRLEFYLTGT